MRKLLYVVIIGAMFFAPVERVEVGKLMPIRALALYLQEDMLVLETDTQLKGRGPSADSALRNLEDGMSAVLFLDTVEYLLVTPDTQEEGLSLKGLLRPSVKVHICEAQDQVAQMAEYLDVHGRVTEMHGSRTK